MFCSSVHPLLISSIWACKFRRWATECTLWARFFVPQRAPVPGSPENRLGTGHEVLHAVAPKPSNWEYCILEIDQRHHDQEYDGRRIPIMAVQIRPAVSWLYGWSLLTSEFSSRKKLRATLSTCDCSHGFVISDAFVFSPGRQQSHQHPGRQSQRSHPQIRHCQFPIPIFRLRISIAFSKFIIKIVLGLLGRNIWGILNTDRAKFFNARTAANSTFRMITNTRNATELVA